MNRAALAAMRRLAGMAGCALMILVVACLIDGMIAGGLKDPFVIDLLPGQEVKLSERMPSGAAKLDDLVLRPSDPRIAVRPEETFSGFWLGGTLWRAEARPAAGLPPGDYRVSVLHHNGSAAEPPQTFTLRLHPDARALRAASGSLATRTLGLSPFVLALSLLLLATLPMAASYVLTRRLGQALHAAGMAEIFRAQATPKNAPEEPAAPAGQRVSFCPGEGHGLLPGSLVEVLDERGRVVLGQAEVLEIRDGNVTAQLQNGVQVRPGALVRLSVAA